MRVAALAMGLLMSAGTAAPAEPLYKWTDDSGEVHYSDSLPPGEAGARRQREVKSPSGTTQDVIEPPPTREQLDAEQRRQEAEAAAARRQQRQEGRDRALLLSFSSVGELERARDQRVDLLGAQIGVLERRVARLENRLERQRELAVRSERTGQGDIAAVYADISSLQQRIRRNREAIEDKQRQQASIRAAFDADIERFRELKQAAAEDR